MALDSLIRTQRGKLRSYMNWANGLVRTPGHPTEKQGQSDLIDPLTL